MSLYSQQDKNVTRTWFLMTMFLVVVIAIGWAISYLYGRPEILYIAVGFSLLMNFVSYWYSDKIVLTMHHARPASEALEHDLINIVENLSITAGLPMPKVYVVNDPAPNAFATGRDKEHAVVAVTSGLLTTLNKTELEGVIAHELSHIGNRDILLSTVVVVLVGFVTILSDMFLRGSFFRDRDSDNKLGGVLFIVGIVLIILSPIVAQLIHFAISRKREFLADASGALLTRYPEGLADALKKISAYNGPMMTANNSTAHLFISNPFGGKVGAISKLFMTHPPMEERVKALMGEKE